MKDINLKETSKQVADHCEHCKRDIYVGEEYYDIDGITICNNCIKDYRKTVQSKE